MRGAFSCPGTHQDQSGQFIETGKDFMMNKDVFEKNWKRLHEQFKMWWNKITDEDLEQVGGKFDEFVGLLQRKYDYTHSQAEEEITRRLIDHETRIGLLQKKYGYTRRHAEEDTNRRVPKPESP
jgi:uncharacterized protein YjbJ (UPF0337 family)